MADTRNGLNDNYQLTYCQAYQEDAIGRYTTVETKKPDSEKTGMSKCVVATNVMIACVAMVSLLTAVTALVLVVIVYTDNQASSQAQPSSKTSQTCCVYIHCTYRLTYVPCL